MSFPTLPRRAFLGSTLATGVAAAAPRMLLSAPQSAALPIPRGTAEHCIYFWLGGGMAQIDTFDPKRRGDPKKKLPGCYYDKIPTNVPGIEVTEHLRRTAEVMDRVAVVRSVTHPQSGEHGTATHFVHTGRRPSETIRYPSIGSIVAHELPPPDGLPSYILMGYPNASRDPGFLGPKAGYLHVADLHAGPSGFAPPADISASRQSRRKRLLDELRRRSDKDPTLRPQAETLDQFQKLAGPEFLSLFDMQDESSTLREAYGGAFGQRCLLARRLVQAGVRFVEVSFHLNFLNGTGWDTHNNGQLSQHLLIQELDAAFSSLIKDLEQHGLLEKVLIVIGTEFGRPPEFDGGGGRGHQSKGFSLVLAGGGLRGGQAYGETDELSKKIISNPVSIPDFLATVCCALKIDPAKELRDGGRPVPITDGGKPIRKLFA